MHKRMMCQIARRRGNRHHRAFHGERFATGSRRPKPGPPAARCRSVGPQVTV